MARRSGSPDKNVQRLHLWQIQAVRDLLLVAAVAGVVWLGYALRAVTVPLLVALLLAYLFEPLVARISRHPRLSRPLVVGGVLATVGIVVVGGLAVLIPVVVHQTSGLVGEYQGGGFRRTAGRLVEYLPEQWHERAELLIEYLPVGRDAQSAASPAGGQTGGESAPPSPQQEARSGEQQIRAIVRDEMQRADRRAEGRSAQWIGVARGGASAAATVIGGIVQLGFLAFLIPFYFFFFSVWYPSVIRFTRGLIPDAHRARVLELTGKMDAVVAGFVRGRIVISLIMGVMFAVGWRLCGVPYSIVVGLVTGLFCAVPYLGVVGLPLAIGLLAFKALGQPDDAMAWWAVLLWPSLVFAVVQVVEGYVLIPLIAGKATNLDPVTILVAVLAGGSIMGVYGMLLAIPVVACLKILCTDVVLPKVRAWTSGEASDPLPLD